MRSFLSNDEASRSLKHSYACVFWKNIYSEDDDVLPIVRLRQKPRDIILPFPPHIGLSVSDGVLCVDNDGKEQYVEFYSDKIEKVQWNNATRIFICEVTPYKVEPKNILGAVINYHEQHAGWIIDGDNPEARKAVEDWKNQRAAAAE